MQYDATKRAIVTVEYAYPTSDNAKRHDRYHAGCYMVTVQHPADYSDIRTVAPFDTVSDAEEYADGLNLPWSPLYLRFPKPGSRFA